MLASTFFSPNLVQVKALQTTPNTAWKNYQENATRYVSLLDDNNDEIHEINVQYLEARKRLYNENVEQYSMWS